MPPLAVLQRNTALQPSLTTLHLPAQASASVAGVQEEGGTSHLSARTSPQP